MIYASLLFLPGVTLDEFRESTPTSIYRARVVKVVDGDTVDLAVDVGFRHVLKDRFRLYGIDAWETRGAEREKGKEASAALLGKLRGRVITIDTLGDRRGKYGRWLVVIWVDGVNINKWLIAQGHALEKYYR